MVVHFPRGFETFDIAVYGHGLSECDCVEAACDFLRKGNANALAENDEEYAFVTL